MRKHESTGPSTSSGTEINLNDVLNFITECNKTQKRAIDLALKQPDVNSLYYRRKRKRVNILWQIKDAVIESDPENKPINVYERRIHHAS